ncbi:MAG TPA: DnaB-like helicase C-terminal domain-containing protein [Terriglobales bacterium]|nr:DnaB-like helicase C-terminal domain-containing protein [Terriglobales bacterium]
MGKTAFAINIAENAAVRDNKVVGVFSLEMSRESLLLRPQAAEGVAMKIGPRKSPPSRAA